MEQLNAIVHLRLAPVLQGKMLQRNIVGSTDKTGKWTGV